MQTQVTFRHFKGHHPQLHAAAEEIAAGFQKFHDGITTTKVEFINENEKIVTFTVGVNGAVLVSKEASDDFHKSLNLAADKIVRQIQKHKTK